MTEHWRRTLLPTDATLQQVIHNLEESGLQIVLVASEDRILVGTLTDGDIRRGLLAGLDLKSPITTIVYREPLVVPPELARETVLQLMQANKIRQMPVVDAQRRVVGLHLWDDLLVSGLRDNLMVIMAGGRGTRLQPHTANLPKPLVPVAGKPMLEHIVERAKVEGFRRFVFAVHYLGSMIEDYFGNGDRWQVSIEYLREQSPLGTAGALALLDPRPDTPLVVSNGDILTDVRYGELLDFHCLYDAAATMAVRMHEWQHPFGVVRTNGVDIVGFEEKPITRSHVNAGIYVLGPQALDLLNPGDHCDMPTLFSRLQEKSSRTIVYPMHEPWLDVGRADDLARAQTARSTR
jgi:dTDP-glucose pyrophosphorylase/predicted transcriptional regulator